MLDRKDPRVRRVPFMTGRPTFNETRRVAGRLATVNLNVVEEEEPSRPSVDEDALSALVDTNFIIANKTMPAREIQEPEEPEIIVPEPALHAAARRRQRGRRLRSSRRLTRRSDRSVQGQGGVHGEQG